MTEVLHDLRLSDSFYTRSELSAPWGLRMPRWDGASFHFVADGTCLLRIADATTRLKTGDLVLIPHGRGHELLDDDSSQSELVTQLPKQRLGSRSTILRHGGGGAQTLVICGGVTFEPHPLISLLPRRLSVGASDGATPEWVQLTLRLMAGEARAPRPLSEIVVTRLADILVIGAVRAWIENSPACKTGWLDALRDDQIGRTLALIHTNVEHAWSVASLALEANMSRASFAERFSELVGTPPMQYLTQRRMHIASRWIRDDKMSLGEVAQRLGYGSDASFSRAFKRTIGVPPSAIRRQV